MANTTNVSNTSNILTITEALAEINVISKRIEVKQAAIPKNILRHESMRDPLESDGGSREYVKRELQSISDLYENIVKIRTSIAEANSKTPITINNTTRTISEWLIWRRDVAQKHLSFLVSLKQGIDRARIDQLKNGHGVATPEEVKAGDLIVNLSEADLVKQIEDGSAALERLDGQLSLKNATTTIEVDF